VGYTLSKSGRRACFFRDPDMNTIEVVETEDWRVEGEGAAAEPLS